MNSDDDNTPLLEHPRRRTVMVYFNQKIAHDGILEFQLLLLSFCTGILDAVTFSSYSCFASKQTGNLILFALNALEPTTVRNNAGFAAVSMASFLAGASIASHMGRSLGHANRFWLVLNNLVPACVLTLAAVSRATSPNGGKKVAVPSVDSYVTLALVGLVCGSQLVLALKIVPEINTSVVTIAMSKIVGDGDAFALRNMARDRRLFFWASIGAGAFAGAGLAKSTGPASALGAAAIVKGVVGVMLLFNRGEVEEEAVQNNGRVA